MKKHLLLFILVVFSTQLHAQYVIKGPVKAGTFAVTTGYIMPFGQITDQFGEYAGGMQNGYSIGVEYIQPFDRFDRIAWNSKVGIFMNPVDFPQGFFDIWIRGDESPWYHITPTVGLRYTPVLKEKLHLFVGAQVGGIIGISPQITTDTRVRTSYFNTSYQRAGYSFSYNWNPFIGIRFLKNFELKGEYLLAGMMEYEVNILNYNGVYQQRFFTVPVQFFNIWLNYAF